MVEMMVGRSAIAHQIEDTMRKAEGFTKERKLKEIRMSRRTWNAVRDYLEARGVELGRNKVFRGVPVRVIEDYWHDYTVVVKK